MSFFKSLLGNDTESYLLTLTTAHLLPAQSPVHSGPSYFSLKVLSTLQKIVLSQTTLVEGLFVSCSAASFINTDKTQPDYIAS